MVSSQRVSIRILETEIWVLNGLASIPISHFEEFCKKAVHYTCSALLFNLWTAVNIVLRVTSRIRLQSIENKITFFSLNNFWWSVSQIFTNRFSIVRSSFFIKISFKLSAQSCLLSIIIQRVIVIKCIPNWRINLKNINLKFCSHLWLNKAYTANLNTSRSCTYVIHC